MLSSLLAGHGNVGTHIYIDKSIAREGPHFPLSNAFSGAVNAAAAKNYFRKTNLSESYFTKKKEVVRQEEEHWTAGIYLPNIFHSKKRRKREERKSFRKTKMKVIP